MVGHGKETETLDLGTVVGPNGGILNLALDSNKYQRPKDCNCGTSYRKHGIEYPQLSQALASWREVYFRDRYYHPVTEQCDNDATSLRIGPPAHLSEWAKPLLDSLYVLGLSNRMISHLLPEGVANLTTVWRRVHDLDPAGLAIHDFLHNILQYDLNRWDRGNQKKDIWEFFTMRVINPPTVGLEVEVRRPIHELTLRWIDARVLRSPHHPTQGNLSFHLI